MKVWPVFALLLLLQLVCGSFLLWDVLASLLGVQYNPVSWALMELIEIGAILGLLFGVIASGLLLRSAMLRQADAESRLRLASGALMEVIEERFAEWSLSPAERDVAMFLIKGLSTGEIAALRNTSEGTVKAQTNAIYRKASVSGRAQLLSLFIEELFVEQTSAAA
ncbi:helix-turn-helix transcriptional regulator [Sagittula stellata]|uniref:Transcriptional regulator, LuxR family protein n=1 Tax=Sagittula stellata (strain ATCC 700073 / DSM 11524 / E-37) TaxID=388399 RepID=A3K8B5_SAGS3|nr:LuxR C-terminal-related transcriptional regulator [Sagittula stellata]EBA06594.1 transcriptional regulator, LuxR family protein [Sagittula stellata E-37]